MSKILSVNVSYPKEVDFEGHWHKVYPNMKMPNGMFGESLLREGLMESGVNVGDVFRIGFCKGYRNSTENAML